MALQRVRPADKEELLALVRRSASAIAPGLEILGGPLGADEFPPIDLVARDARARPLLLFAGLACREETVLYAAAQAEWFVRQRSILVQLFPGLRIDPAAPPRAVLICPEFPLLTRKFIRTALPSHPPLLFQYRCYEALGRRFLDLERVREPEAPGPAGRHRFRAGILSHEVEITPEEREAFFS